MVTISIWPYNYLYEAVAKPLYYIILLGDLNYLLQRIVLNLIFSSDKSTGENVPILILILIYLSDVEHDFQIL